MSPARAKYAGAVRESMEMCAAEKLCSLSGHTQDPLVTKGQAQSVTQEEV